VHSTFISLIPTAGVPKEALYNERKKGLDALTKYFSKNKKCLAKYLNNSLVPGVLT
jgi:hypothetical protein